MIKWLTLVARIGGASDKTVDVSGKDRWCERKRATDVSDREYVA